jgi:hypothetical protein
LGELEWGALETDTSGRVLKHEAVIDVNHTAARVDHYIGIMPVFYIKKVVVETVAGEGLHKILLGLLKIVSKVLLIEGLEGPSRNLGTYLLREFLLQRI